MCVCVCVHAQVLLIRYLFFLHRVDQSEFMQYMEVENHDDFYSFEASNQIRVWDQQGVGVVYDSAIQDLSSLEKELLTVASYYLTKCPHTETEWVAVV